jgi:hypothetical protein
MRKNKITGLKKFKGKLDLDIDMDDLRCRRCRPFCLIISGKMKMISQVINFNMVTK